MTGPRETSSLESSCLRPPANDDRVPNGLLARYRSLWLVGLPVVVLFSGGLLRIWVAEDAFITFRSVESLWQGYGPVYNRGIRVESFSHPLWFLTLCALRMFGSANLAPLSAVVGIICSIAGLGLAARAAWLRCETGLRLFPLGALAIACLPPFWDFASSGLETGMTFLWLGWCSYSLTRCQSTRSRIMRTSFLIGLGPLIRPDFAVITLCLLLALAFTPKASGATRLQALLLAIFPAAVWQVFRMGYYAAIVPTTFLAKESLNSVWWRGYLYIDDFLRTYEPEWILMLGAFALLGRSLRFVSTRDASGDVTTKLGHDRVIAALCVGGALHILSVCRVGGDFMHARFLLPGVFAILASFAIVPLPRAVASRLIIAVGALVWCGWTAACARTPYGIYASPIGISNERLWHVLRADDKKPLTVKDYGEHFFVRAAQDLRQKTESEGYRAVFVPNIGIPASQLATDVVVVDSLGLNDYIGARMRLTHYGRPGHEKNVPSAWFLARYPAPQGYISPMQSSRVSARLPSTEALSAARRVLESPQLLELRDAVTAPVTLGRFMNNIRLAWKLTFLRIPSDPEEAELELHARKTLNSEPARIPSQIAE
jgi:arabinofuranosyltransferase